jgi:hypothetical protein
MGKSLEGKLAAALEDARGGLTLEITLLDNAKAYCAAYDRLLGADLEVSLAAPLGALASHCLELTLKSYLAKAGVDEARLRKHFRHHLKKLWKACRQSGLPVGKPPDWVKSLHAGHSKSLGFRYPGQDGAFGAIVLPDLQALRESLKFAIELVETTAGVRVIAPAPHDVPTSDAAQPHSAAPATSDEPALRPDAAPRRRRRA